METESGRTHRSSQVRAISIVFFLAACGGSVSTQAQVRSPAASGDSWQAPTSRNLVPHFEQANGRKVLYVDGRPFTVLAVEIPWWDLIYPRYKETETAYDNLYPAAAKLGLNALKVPIKWSMVEPEKGIYDFSYLDHARSMAQNNHLKLILNWFGHYASGDGTIYGNLTGELYAPMYIASDEKTYPRAVDADGVAHHNTISYDYAPILDRETAAFSAFMRHIKEIDSATHTILMIQVENEIAVFGSDRHNQKLWRDHSAPSNQRFAEHHFTDDLEYSAWDLSYNWIRRITDAGAAEYPIPFFHNYVGGKVADWMVGGAPGEDVLTYLHNCPHLSFIGVNSYFCAEWRPDNSCARESQATVDELRQPLLRYRVGRNLPAITEINSGSTPVTSRLAYIAVGDFGAPIYAPWALTVSYPESYEPYILSDGTEANGAAALRETYSSLSKALPQVSYYATTDKLKVFMADAPGQRFSQTQDVNGSKVTVAGEHNGQAIVIHPSASEFLIIGFRAGVSLTNAIFEWPAMKNVFVQRVRWATDHFENDGEPSYGVDQSNKSLYVDLQEPQAVRVSW
jgi:Glycosyl hydrolases family 35